MSTIEFRNVRKIYPKAATAALADISLTIHRGEFVILLGPSGCGKTTLMKMINRLIEPSSGTILLDGVDIQAINATKLRQQIGYVIQQVGLFPHMTVAENIAVVPKLLGWPKAKIQNRIDELLQLIQLDPVQFRQRYPAQISGGQAQRVGLARALAADPGVMLMDEPFGAIDAITRTALQDEMLRIQQQLQKTIVFVTHDVEEALRLADKIAILHEGTIVQYDTPLNLLRNPANHYVAELLGADDLVRRLSLIQVRHVLQPLPASYDSTLASIESSRNLRDGLNQLLASSDDQLLVVEHNQPIGVLSLAAIHAYLHPEVIHERHR